MPVRLAIPSELKEAGVDLAMLDLPSIGIKPGGRWWNPKIHWTALAYWALTIGVLFVVFSIALRFGAPGWSLGVIAFAVFPFLAFSPIARWWWNAVGDKFVDQVLRTGHCPACGFSLEDLQEEEDGCVVCPECGAAWKQRKIRPSWIREV